MLTEHQGSSRHVAVVIYVCTGETDSAERLADYCGTYAAAREWHVVGIIMDTDCREALTERTGWRRVQETLSSGAARGVVTLTHAMVADTPEEFEALCVLAAEVGAFVTCARSGAPDKPPRRSPGDTLRRMALATAAAGWPEPWSFLFTPRPPTSAEGAL